MLLLAPLPGLQHDTVQLHLPKLLDLAPEWLENWIGLLVAVFSHIVKSWAHAFLS